MTPTLHSTPPKEKSKRLKGIKVRPENKSREERETEKAVHLVMPASRADPPPRIELAAKRRATETKTKVASIRATSSLCPQKALITSLK